MKTWKCRIQLGGDAIGTELVVVAADSHKQAVKKIEAFAERAKVKHDSPSFLEFRLREYGLKAIKAVTGYDCPEWRTIDIA